MNEIRTEVAQTPKSPTTESGAQRSLPGRTQYMMGDIDYDSQTTMDDVLLLRSIGCKSVNDFTAENLEKAAKWAYKFYVTDKLGIKTKIRRALW